MYRSNFTVFYHWVCVGCKKLLCTGRVNRKQQNSGASSQFLNVNGLIMASRTIVFALATELENHLLILWVCVTSQFKTNWRFNVKVHFSIWSSYGIKCICRRVHIFFECFFLVNLRLESTLHDFTWPWSTWPRVPSRGHCDLRLPKVLRIQQDEAKVQRWRRLTSGDNHRCYYTANLLKLLTV